MRAAEVMALLNQTEEDLPVDEWRIRDIAVWPLVRRDIAWALEDVAAAGTPRSHAQVWRHRATAGLGSLGVAATQAFRDGRNHARSSGRSDVVMLGDTISRTWLDDAWYDEFFDPIATALEAMGMSSLLLETGRRVRLPRHRPAWSVQGQLDMLKLRSLAAKPAVQQCRLPRYDEFLAIMRGFEAAHVFEPTALWRRVYFVDLAARFFEPVLRRRNARLGMADIDGPIAMAFYLACRRAGLTSVELQHGVQGELHWGHGPWKRLPEQGYALLPARFWTWREYEAQTIRGWAGSASHHHRAVVGGRPWLSLWRHGDDPMVSGYDRRIETLLRRTGAQLHVLVTLQTGIADADWLRRLAEAARATPSWFWWVRGRSSMTGGELDAVRRMVQGLHNAETEQATLLPLYALLRHVDAHVTAFSSAAIEAAAFGVPTVATSGEAVTWFPTLAEKGWLVVADEPDQMVTALREQVVRAEGRPPLDTEPGRPPRATLEELIGVGQDGAEGMGY